VLQAVECDYVQGYLFGAALTAEEIGALLAEGALVS
jgi:EAL domain-containing protein (putative c-di-GMP-specific phosphodiesterase class I)